MFFNICRRPLPNFPCQWLLGDLVINTDQGWQKQSVGSYEIVYKGYLDRAVLSQNLEQLVTDTVPVHTGNFCAIAYHRQEKTFRICSDLWRSFPIYLDPGIGINNLIPTDRVAWTDSLVTFDSDLLVQEIKFDAIGALDSHRADTQSIRNLLLDKSQDFYDNNPAPIKIFLSGGVDTMLVYSLVLALDLPHEMIWANHIEHDHFWLQNHRDIQQHWAYQQIHHWTDPSVLASGAPGDEFMMRSPTTANLWLLAQGSSIPDLIQSGDLHWAYYNKPVHQSLFQQQKIDHTPIENIKNHLCNIVLNDWQHWHLGRTLTWTPLRDLDLFKIVLSMDTNRIKSQISSSEVSIDVMEQNPPGLSKMISDQKNHGNAMANLVRWREIVPN